MTFPVGYPTERPRLEHVPEILALVNASDIAAIGFPDFDESEVIEALTAPKFDPAADSWLVRDPGGRLVGWGYLDTSDADSDFFCEAYVHPEEAADLQTPLIELLLARATERGGVLAKAGAIPTEKRYVRILEAAGFEFHLQHARMTRNLTGAEQLPDPLPGITVRTMRPEELEEFFGVVCNAFADTHHPIGHSFAEFEQQLANQDVHWDGWLVAEAENGRLVGALRSSTPPTDPEGWVKTLGVLGTHRGRGIGRVLLATAFARYATEGRTAVGLGVDTTNPTGAYRLYESLGMTPAYQANIYQRKLSRDGLDG